jgi:acyl carrier protein
LNEKEILARVRDCITKTLDQPNLTITMRTVAEDVEGWDSFAHVNIVVALESEFGLEFNAAEIEELRVVGEMVEVIEKKLAKAG